jgi:hypothetical protein
VSTDSTREWALSAPDIGKAPRLILSIPEAEAEEEYVEKHGLGIYEVGFLVEEGGGKDTHRTPYGIIDWVSSG